MLNYLIKYLILAFYFDCFTKESYSINFLSLSKDCKLINEKMKQQITNSDKSINLDYLLKPINLDSKVFIHRQVSL